MKLKWFDAHILKPKDGDLPFNPVGHIVLKKPPHNDKHAGQILGYQLMSSAEVDYLINELISDLEKVRQKFKKNLS